MSAAAQNPPRVDTMASQMSAADQANSAAKAEAAKAAKSSLIGKGIRSLGLGMGPSAVESMSDIIAPEDWAAKNKALDIGGMRGALGWYADKVGEGFKQGNERIAQNMAGLGDTIKSNIAQPLNEFWNGPQPDAGVGDVTTPQTPPTTLPQTPQAQTPQAQTPQAQIPQAQIPQAQTPQQGVRKRDDGVIVNSKSAGKADDTKQNAEDVSDTHGYGTPNSVDNHPAGNPINALLATTQATQAADKTSDTGMGQGSILDSLYSKLKDSDVDYSDLAKRISQNEYDLARERKDGTFNAILGGVGAALTQAGTYQGVGDRVFKPGLGTIAGAGIMGGLKMSAASDEAISKKSQDNMTAMIALKKLKRESMNDVLDALSAQKQVDAITRGQDITAGTHAATVKQKDRELLQQAPLIAAQIDQYTANANHLNATAQQLLANKTMSDADKENLKTMLSQYNTLVDARKKEATNIGATPDNIKYYDDRINPLEIALGKFTGVDLSKVGTGGSGANPRGTIVGRTQLPQ
jgi:hypothetical protein